MNKNTILIPAYFVPPTLDQNMQVIEGQIVPAHIVEENQREAKLRDEQREYQMELANMQRAYQQNLRDRIEYYHMKVAKIMKDG